MVSWAGAHRPGGQSRVECAVLSRVGSGWKRHSCLVWANKLFRKSVLFIFHLSTLSKIIWNNLLRNSGFTHKHLLLLYLIVTVTISPYIAFRERESESTCAWWCLLYQEHTDSIDSVHRHILSTWGILSTKQLLNKHTLNNEWLERHCFNFRFLRYLENGNH